MVQMSLYLLGRVGLEFFEFLKESDRDLITDRDELKDIYNYEFKDREAREPNFGSVLYALKHADKITRGDTIYFSPKVTYQYLDQWASFRDHQPGWIQNGEDRPRLEEAVSRVRARRKLANTLMNSLKIDRAQLIADKRGVSIWSDHEFEDGNIRFCTESANEYVVNLTVKNKGSKPVYFTYYTPLRWLRHFFLNDEHHVTKTNPLTLKPGDGYKMQVRFHCSLLGVYVAPLAFEFQPDLQSSRAFHIVRFIEAKTVPSSFFSAYPPHADHAYPNICGMCRLFYNTFVAIAPNKCRALERGTVEQRNSHMWHDARKIRITASTAKKVPIRGDPQNYIKNHLNPTFKGNEATHHGIESEKLAIEWIESHGDTVTRKGTVVCETEPWLSASPDGVLNSGGGDQMEELLEIKCPLLKDNESLDDLFRKANYDVKMEEGTPELQPNGQRGFYMQVQLGMFCTGLRTCQLLIWTPEEQVWLTVTYDERFCVDTVERLREFYFNDMLPHVSNEFKENRLWLSARYVQLCKK